MLTDEQVKEAIDQMKVQCDLAMPGYHPISARSALVTLGYPPEHITQVLQYLYDRGFTNCLDHEFLSTFYNGNEVTKEYPRSAVCYWGPDQLKSRLWSIR
jgi:hypothetical protein